MCGILGYYSKHKKINKLEFQSALESFRHRGPDSQKLKVFPNTLIFGHNRLSIQDLSERGSQPMKSQCHRYEIIFNGEIYNAPILKKQLSNYNFSNSTDTEVILALISKMGINNALPQLQGMFSIGVYDLILNKVYLARDLFGEKPLYYYLDKSSNTFCFSSSIQSIRKLTKQSNINEKALYEFISYGYISEKNSIYKNIEKLEPSCLLTLDLNSFNVHIENYSNLPYNQNKIDFKRKTDFENHLHQELLNVIKETLVADVEVGTFLSGGIDSSLITALVAKTNPDVMTFSVGFKEKKFDESNYAKLVAEYLNLNHTAIEATPTNCFSILKDLPKIYEEPFADSSQIPTALVCQEAKKKVSVALTGDGADELFHGYDRYTQFIRAISVVNLIPEPLKKPIIKMIKTPFFNWLVENRQVYGRKINPSLIKKFVSMLEYEDHEERYHMILKRSYEVDIEPNLLYANNRYFDLRLYDISHYLPSDILVKVDRAAMFNSLETRSPFLNKRIADLAFSNFHNSLIDNNYQKGVLKAILLDYFPEEFFNRKKAGFSLPIGQWVRSDWKEYFFDVYNSKSQIDDFIIKRCQTDLEREVLNKNDHNIYKVWDIFIFKQWESFYN